MWTAFFGNIFDISDGVWTPKPSGYAYGHNIRFMNLWLNNVTIKIKYKNLLIKGRKGRLINGFKNQLRIRT